MSPPAAVCLSVLWDVCPSLRRCATALVVFFVFFQFHLCRLVRVCASPARSNACWGCWCGDGVWRPRVPLGSSVMETLGASRKLACHRSAVTPLYLCLSWLTSFLVCLFFFWVPFNLELLDHEATGDLKRPQRLSVMDQLQFHSVLVAEVPAVLQVSTSPHCTHPLSAPASSIQFL